MRNRYYIHEQILEHSVQITENKSITLHCASSPNRWEDKITNGKIHEIIHTSAKFCQGSWDVRFVDVHVAYNAAVSSVVLRTQLYFHNGMNPDMFRWKHKLMITPQS